MYAHVCICVLACFLSLCVCVCVVCACGRVRVRVCSPHNTELLVAGTAEHGQLGLGDKTTASSKFQLVKGS